MINTPLALRWARAQRIVEQAIPLGYMVGVQFGKQNELIACVCGCPDRRKMVEQYDLALDLKFNGLDDNCSVAGIPLWRGIVVCKHTLALALSIHLFIYSKPKEGSDAQVRR